jgi:hypothetical protein
MKDATATAFTVAKSTVELYKIRPATGFAWADITIDAHERGGRISIASDYGNWQNYWGAAGCDFKSFLGQINQHYAAGKFGAERWIDVDKSLKGFRKMVAEYKKSGALPKDEAAEIRAELDELRHESADSISRAIEHSRKLFNFLYTNAGEVDFEYEPNPHFARFWKEIWPVLLAEFAREKAAPPTPAPIQEGKPAGS